MEKESRLQCIAGDDVYLKYYHKCGDCGTIIIDNHHDMKSLSDYDCPICDPGQKDFPFEYVTVDQIDNYEVFALGGTITLKQRLEMGLI